MAELITGRWQPAADGMTRRQRREGEFSAYLPDALTTRPLLVREDLALEAAHVETAVRALGEHPNAPCLDALARLLLRSEAIASSRIEGVAASPQQVALAEFAMAEGLSARQFSDNARLIANNIRVVRQATTGLASAPLITVEGIDELHRGLLPNVRLQGLRKVQNWIGGDDWSPIDAAFVPPPPDAVPRLMADLASYASGAAHSPLIQAGMVHAQFETIHPYADGNGRVGRALIHTVLTRRGLARSSVLPVSLVLLTRAESYRTGLQAFAHLGPAEDAAAQDAADAWLRIFIDATKVAVEQARSFAEELTLTIQDWTERLVRHREEAGMRGRPRSDSASVRLLAMLAEVPVVTPQSVHRLLGVSEEAARGAVDTLAGAGILTKRRLGRTANGYVAADVFELLTIAERRLASTRWDTRLSAPVRPVADPPR